MTISLALHVLAWVGIVIAIILLFKVVFSGWATYQRDREWAENTPPGSPEREWFNRVYPREGRKL